MVTSFRGVGLVVLAMLLFSITYAFYKACSPYLSNMQIIFFPSLCGWILVFPFALKNGIKNLISPQLGKIALRTLSGLFVVFCISQALRTVGLAEVVLLNNTSPLFVPLILFALHKTAVSYKLILSLLVGFGGVFIVLSPSFNAIPPGLIFAGLSGFFSALLVVITRQIAHEPILRILFYYFLILWMVSLPFVFSEWSSPPMMVWLYIFLAATTLVLAQISFTTSLRYATSYEIAPFLYTAVVFAGLIDWAIWKISPTLTTFIGMITICAGGIMTMKFNRGKSASMEAIAIFDPVRSAELLKLSAKELGFKVIGVFTKNLEFFNQQFHLSKEEIFRDCDEVIVSENKEEILERFKASNFSIKAAIAGLDMSTELRDQIAYDLNLWSNFLGLSKARRDKGEMRQLIKQDGFSCPDFQICYSEEDLLNFAMNHSFPMVVKTPKGLGTHQVYVCDNMKNLILNFQDILHKENIMGDRTKHAILEEYIDGKEYIVDTFSDGKKVHATDVWFYEKIDSENFKNIYYNAISIPLSDPSVKHLIDHALNLAKAFKLKRGPAHFEIKDDPKRGPTLIEINARLAGAGLPIFLKRYTNFDPYKKTIEVFLHGKTQVPDPIVSRKHFAVAFFPLLKTGEVKTIYGIEEIKRLASYDGHKLIIKPGDFISATTDLTTIPLLVYLAHSNRKRLLKDLEKAHELFNVEMRSARKPAA